MYTSAFQVWLLAGGLTSPPLLRPAAASLWSAARSTCRPRIRSSTAASGPGNRCRRVLAGLAWPAGPAPARPGGGRGRRTGQRRDRLPACSSSPSGAGLVPRSGWGWVASSG